MASQTLSVLSKLAVTTCFSSGVNAIAYTVSVCPLRLAVTPGGPAGGSAARTREPANANKNVQALNEQSRENRMVGNLDGLYSAGFGPLPRQSGGGRENW